MVGTGVYGQQYFITDYSTKPFFNANVQAIEESENGYMWFANYTSLVKYWGGQKAKLFEQKNGQSMLPFGILEDSEGVMWVATSGGLLYTKGNHLEKYLFKDSTNTVSNFFRVYEDSARNIWALAGGKIVCLVRDKNTNAFVEKEIKIGVNRVASFFQKDKNTIWFGTANGICKLAGDSLQQIITIKKNKRHTGTVYNIFRWYDGRIYFTDNYLNVVGDSGTFQEILYYGNNEASAFFCSVKNDMLAISSFSDTLRVYRKTKLEFVTTAQEHKQGEWRSLKIDKAGNVWAALNNGLIRISQYPVSPVIKLPLKADRSTQMITMLKSLDDDYFIAGTKEYSFYKIDTKTNTATNLNWQQSIVKALPVFKGGTSMPLNLFFKNGQAHILTGGNGLLSIDTSTRKVTRYPISTLVLFHHYQQADTFWLGGTSLLKFTNGKVEAVNTTEFSGHYIWSINKFKYCDSLFMPGQRGVLVYYGGKTSLLKTKTPWPSNISTFSMLDENDSSKIVFADGHGIYRMIYTKAGIKFSTLLDKNNSYADFKFTSGVMDSSGNILVQFNNASFLQKMQQIKGEFFMQIPLFTEKIKDFYTSDDPAIICKSSFYWANNGTIYRAGIYNSDFFRKVQPVKITNLEIKNYSFDTLSAAKEYPENVILSSNQNTLHFQFSQVDFNNTGNFTYEYYLEGSNEKPYENVTEENTGVYRNLPAGKYVFHVRSRNNYDENGNLVEAAYSFTILPPWYQAWWGYCIWGILALALLCLIGIWRLNVMRKNAVVKKKRIDNELKALRAQINPHFIQNTFDLMAHGIYNGNPDEAIGIIKKVSAYLRQVLYKSEICTMSLEDELEYTEDYLKMQQMVMPGLFTYIFETGDEVDTFFIQVPSMLLQPIVENCIKHGFKKMLTGGKIEIKTEGKDGYIKLIIKDNGSGLAVEGENIKGASKGIELTRRRITLMFTGRHKLKAKVEMYNRKDGIAGTEFSIQFPSGTKIKH